MTVQSVIQQVCPFVGVNVPVFSVFSASNPEYRTMQEMVALATEMAQRIAYDTRDWQVLRKTATFTGTATRVFDVASGQWVWTGGAASFDMPFDYKRMLLSSNVWRSTSTQQPMRFIADSDEWLQRRLANETDAWGEWTLKGGQMHIYPVLHGAWDDPATTANPDIPAETVTFDYLDKNCVALAGPPPSLGTTFVADTDSFRLDERLLRLGMIWQWKAHKGSPYAEDMGTYSDALANNMGHDQPAPILMGRTALSANARVAYPWPVPT